jgi:hypothetical protein
VLDLVQWRAKGRPPGRVSLVVGWARAMDREFNERGIHHPDEKAFYGAVATTRYLQP